MSNWNKYGTYNNQWATKAFGDTEIPYASARIWGTGINPVHEFYGEGPPVRVLGREGEQGSAGYGDQYQSAFESMPEELVSYKDWCYTIEDTTTNQYIDYDGRPNWGEQPPQFRGETDDYPGWEQDNSGTATGASAAFKAKHDGARRFHVEKNRGNATPSETVSEGWLNKPKGEPADSRTSDPIQYERQTSMQQRYATRNNDNAVARATDWARSVIESRVVGQKLKVYSGQERHYDMFPFQQDEMLRPFTYRRAGTGNPAMMLPNEMYVSSPMQRVTPADPGLGPDETSPSDPYGYTGEDMSYAY